MMLDLDDLAVIDLGASPSNRQFGEELLRLLIKRLPQDIAELHKSHKENNLPILLQQTHKLHGALCYCGVPRLKTVVAALESNIKNNIMVDLSYLFDQLDIEVTLLLEQYILYCDMSTE